MIFSYHSFADFGCLDCSLGSGILIAIYDRDALNAMSVVENVVADIIDFFHYDGKIFFFIHDVPPFPVEVNTAAAGAFLLTLFVSEFCFGFIC
jgi:hypothetical protein